MSQAYTTSDAWDMFSHAFEQFSDMITQLRADASRQLEHGQVEQFLDTEGRELLRRLLQGHLDYRAAHAPDWESLEGADGILRSHPRQGCESHRATRCGDVIVTRRASRTPGASSLCA